MNKILDFLNLHNGEEPAEKVLANVRNNISFKGANLWILACAIVIASVGLNVNSTAVVIGAMLISPLMGPIVGSGFALGTYDFPLLKKSFKNLIIATLVGLVVSSVYFFLSPFKDVQSEILSRTAPNIYDIMIAFFGGLVGVIAVTRVEKGNPIPGVAIATALMPPLCTAGFGLAVGNYAFFFGALYLYTINCVFICIATFSIVKFLNYPSHGLINEKHEKLIRNSITAAILVMLIPSVYFAYTLFQEKKYEQKVSLFINTEFSQNGYTLIYKKTDFKTEPKQIELAFLTKKFTPKETADLNKKLEYYDINNTLLTIKQDTSNLKNDILNEISKSDKTLNEKDQIIQSLQQEIARNKYANLEILNETKLLFPKINNLSIANHSFVQSDTSVIVPVMIYTSQGELKKEELQKLRAWLLQRLNIDKLELYKEAD